MRDKTKERIRIKNSVAARRAGVTTRTLRRWDEDEAVGYPKPVIVRGRIYRWLDEIESWEARNPDFGRPKLRHAS